MADLEDFFQHANSRRLHNLLVLMEREPKPTMIEVLEAFGITKQDLSELNSAEEGVPRLQPRTSLEK